MPDRQHAVGNGHRGKLVTSVKSKPIDLLDGIGNNNLGKRRVLKGFSADGYYLKSVDGGGNGQFGLVARISRDRDGIPRHRVCINGG